MVRMYDMYCTLQVCIVYVLRIYIRFVPLCTFLYSTKLALAWCSRRLGILGSLDSFANPNVPTF